MAFPPSSHYVPYIPEPKKRDLVTVRQIARMFEIKEDPDVVEVNFEGCSWPVLIPKREDMFKIDDLVVFFELDSFIPKSDPRYAPLFDAGAEVTIFKGREGHRVKTIMKGLRVSQGIIFPLSLFPEIRQIVGLHTLQVGKDMARMAMFTTAFDVLLNITKWEPTPLATIPGKTLGLCPNFIPQPVWVRAQNITEGLFNNQANTNRVWQITEKLDGVTMHIYKRTTPTPEIGVCSRVHKMMDNGSNLYWETARSSTVISKIHDIPYPNIVIQGELVGSTIENNSMNYPPNTHEFMVFGIWDMDKGSYIGPKIVEDLCRGLEIPHVKVIDYAPVEKWAKNIDELLDFARRTGRFGAQREGLVFKSLNGEMIWKVISNEYLGVTGN